MDDLFNEKMRLVVEYMQYRELSSDIKRKVCQWRREYFESNGVERKPGREARAIRPVSGLRGRGGQREGCTESSIEIGRIAQ